MRMDKILITGAAGFIGSHLVERCVELGYSIKAFVRYNSRNSWGWLEESEYKNDIEIVAGDVRDYDSVMEALEDCAAVFHLAALIGIPYSYKSPLAYIKTNIEGTYNVLQAAKDLNVENILITSTSETYGTAQYVPIDEKHPMMGKSPYSATKIGADQLALSFYRSLNLPVKVVRPFNVYGPRQSARAIIPAIIIQVLSGKKKIKLGNLDPKRDLTYIKDTVKGFIEIYKSDKLYGEIINIGTKSEISIGELAKLISKLIGKKIEIICDEQRVRPPKSEVERLFCDNTKIIENTNWRPLYSLNDGLIETIKWIKSHLKIYKSELYNV